MKIYFRFSLEDRSNMDAESKCMYPHHFLFSQVLDVRVRRLCAQACPSAPSPLFGDTGTILATQ